MKFISDDDLEGHALAFLKQHHPSLSIPVPIENILGRQLKVKLIPLADLKSDFGIDGCLARDMKQIFVDMDLMMNVEFRTRFTIAHEVGHLVLHQEYIRNFQPNDASNWKAIVMGDKAWGRMEYQAHQFAAFCLIPTAQLKEFVSTNQHEQGSENLVRAVAIKFHVSDEVARRRLTKCGLF